MSEKVRQHGRNMVPRRDFLKGVATAGAVVAVECYWSPIEKVYKAITIASDVLSNFPDYRGDFPGVKAASVLPDNLRPPESLRVVSLNDPFGWRRSETEIRGMLGKARKMGVKNIRIFVDDTGDQYGQFGFERAGLGQFDKKVIPKIREFARILEDEANDGEIPVGSHSNGTPDIAAQDKDGILSLKKKEPITFSVCLFDSYKMLHSDELNLVYPTESNVSPYLIYNDHYGHPRSSQRAKANFYTDPLLHKAFDARVQTLIEGLKDLKNLSGWEVANALETVGIVDKQYRTDIMTDWYEGRLDNIFRADPNRPVITGLAVPWLIETSRFVQDKYRQRSIINSFQAYPLIDRTFIKNLQGYFRKEAIPTICTEFGVPDHFSFIRLDENSKIPQFLTRLLNLCVMDGSLYVEGFAPWKTDNYYDAFTADPDRDPEVGKAMTALSEILAVKAKEVYRNSKREAIIMMGKQIRLIYGRTSAVLSAS